MLFSIVFFHPVMFIVGCECTHMVYHGLVDEWKLDCIYQTSNLEVQVMNQNSG